MITPKPKSKSKLKGQDALKAFQKQISPKGVAAADAAARKALEEKYPGMFIPQTRTTGGLRNDKRK
jgi:hypothetical protein